MQLTRRRLRNAWLAVEALFELTFSRSLVVFVPFRAWSRVCGKFQCESLRESVPPSEIGIIRKSILRVARWLPWKSRCLDQAVAAQRMLFRRQLATTLYLGMQKSVEGSWKAHAWVRCGQEWVIGYDARQSFTVVGTYAKFRPV